MRITSGQLKGRKVMVPRSGVRPTQDRVREALFSSLQTVIAGSRFLDLFSGSGAVGVEAWSRGAESVAWVESDPNTFRLLKDNVHRLCGRENVSCFSLEVMPFLKRNPPDNQFDIIFADPPYQKKRDRSDVSRNEELLAAVKSAGILSSGGILILEQGKREGVLEIEGWTIVRDKVYGGSRLLSYYENGGSVDDSGRRERITRGTCRDLRRQRSRSGGQGRR